jgi:hypothetical protein
MRGGGLSLNLECPLQAPRKLREVSCGPKELFHIGYQRQTFTTGATK